MGVDLMGVFSFGGVDLSADLKVLEISRQIGNSRSVSGNSAPKLGENIEEVSIDSKTITVRVSFASRSIGATAFVDTIAYATVSNKNLQELREKIAGVLHTTVPKKLILPDEEGRYYNAIPVGDISLAGISDWYDEFEIEFKIPDGVAHSTTYRSFETTGNQNKITVTNNGTVDAFPIFTVKHTSENGYVGLVNTSGVFQVGNIEESDQEHVKQSEILMDYRNKDFSTIQFEQNTGIFNTSDWELSGNVGFINRFGLTLMQMNTRYGTQGQHGASASFEIPADSTGEKGGLHDYLYYRLISELTNVEKAILKISVTDVNDKFMFGIQAYKNSFGMTGYYSLLADNGSGKPTTLSTHSYKTSNKPNENPLCNSRGTLDLNRHDDKVTYYWDGSYYTKAIPLLKGRRSKKIHIMFGQFGNSPYANCNYLHSFMYRKADVEFDRDIKNMYQPGDSLVINSENDTILVGDNFKLQDFVTGSKFLSIPPGVSDIEIYNSSWATAKPHVKVEFEERWL